MSSCSGPNGEALLAALRDYLTAVPCSGPPSHWRGWFAESWRAIGAMAVLVKYRPVAALDAAIANDWYGATPAAAKEQGT